MIIVKTGSSYGKCGIARALPEKATINPQLAVLKYILCDRNYLHIVLNSSMAHRQYEDFVIGAATPTFSQEDLANFVMPLPPLAEQKRIVAKLEEECLRKHMKTSGKFSKQEIECVCRD